MGIFRDILGTTNSFFQILKGGVKLNNNSGGLKVTNASGVESAVTASEFDATGDSIVINSNAAESADDWKLTISRPASGMTGNVEIKMPTSVGSPGQALVTDGNNPAQMSFASVGSTADCTHVYDTTVAYDASSPVTLLTMAGTAEVVSVEVIPTTAFNGANPLLSVGVAGTLSKYMASTQNDLKGTAKDCYVSDPREGAPGSPEDIIATLAADSSTAGGCIVRVIYTTPV